MGRWWRATLAALVAVLAAMVVGAGAARADGCGDTAGQWVPSTGSAWSGTYSAGGGTGFTVVFVTAANLATTVVAPTTGLGTWAYTYDMQWTSTALGVWSYRWEVTATACAGGMVTAAAGGTTDALGQVYSVVMTRTV